jgi:hypothetical protein
MKSLAVNVSPGATQKVFVPFVGLTISTSTAVPVEDVCAQPTEEKRASRRHAQVARKGLVSNRCGEEDEDAIINRA